jgi:uncharacterized protein (DUF427 family)
MLTSHMKATLNGRVVAEAPESELVSIEGNWYFPPSSIADGALADSPTPYTCPWKGVAQYHNVAGQADAGWSYPTPFPGAVDRVGHEFAGYVAFDRRVVEVS